MENSDSKKNIPENSNCAGCMNKLGEDEYITALAQDWHKECFRCSVCDVLLSSWYFEKAGLLFCREDYWSKFGENCHQCSQVITGPVMVAGDYRYHPECFTCAACCAPIEEDEPYALLEHTTLYCGKCYNCTSNGSALRPHRNVSMELAVPQLQWARALLQYAATLCVHFVCYSLSGSCGARGGRGTRGGAAGHADRALTAASALVQITVEHDDSTIKTIPNQKETENTDIPKTHSIDNPPSDQRADEDVVLRRDRLFKRKGEAAVRGRGIKRRQTPCSPLLADKERSSSLSKLLDAVEGEQPDGGGVLGELSRARSFRAGHAAHGPAGPSGPERAADARHTVFRPADLVQGELLGAGFFGQVYRVTHRDTGEVMVLKQLYRLDEHAQRNFLKEVAVLRSVNHPNVLRFIGVLYRDQRLHLVTEYVPGGTLHQLLQDASVPLDWLTRARLARDVCSGLAHLHARSLIHRDLNSHNILVREDKSVVVADFGLARIVRRETASHGSLRRKRYTVVGNPYWMAPEMMNGDLYDESVDVFSFGIVLCEIIGRVSADPDEMPRRSDFGLHEARFRAAFCCGTPPPPEPLVRLALQACSLHPDKRPRCEVMEQWLERLTQHLQRRDEAALRRLLEDMLRAAPPEEGGADAPKNALDFGIIKSQSNAAMLERAGEAGRLTLGKCVSCSTLAPRAAPAPRASLSRSGYILRERGPTIDITKVADITAWLEPEHGSSALPAFLRNQSVETLSTTLTPCSPTSPYNRQHSAPSTAATDTDSDSSGDDEHIGAFYRRVSSIANVPPERDRERERDKRNILNTLVKRGEHLLANKASYDVTGDDVKLRNPECLTTERRIPEVDCRRFNIDFLTHDPIMAAGVVNIPKIVAKEKPDKPPEKTNFFAKKLLSPKLSRLFKPNTAEVVRNKPEHQDADEKSKSKFFIQRPTYRVRPAEGARDQNLGRPLTPPLRRHHPDTKDFAGGRFSCRERRRKNGEYDHKFNEICRNKQKPDATHDKAKLAPLERSTHINNIPSLEKCKERRGKEVAPKPGNGISRSNYVSLANLKINGKAKELQHKGPSHESSPVERVVIEVKDGNIE